MKPKDSTGTPTSSGNKVLMGVLCLLGLFALCGFRYPVIGRNAVLQDLPRTLVWWSLGLAIFATTGLVALTREPGERLGTLMPKWCVFYFLGLLWSVTFLLAVNGVFDYRAHHLYPAHVLDHHVVHGVVHGNHIDQYYLVLADWQQPGSRVTVEVAEALYDKIDYSINSDQMAQVETAPGCLGFERVVKVASIAPADESKVMSTARDDDLSGIFSKP